MKIATLHLLLMSSYMRLQLLKLGGYENFAEYEKKFKEIYESRTLYDVLENEVLFNDPSVNGDKSCSHVCFGGSVGHWGNITYWSQERAERILWIEAALTSPNIKIHNDSVHEKRRRYLLVVDAVPEENLPTEFFCVIVEVKNKKTVNFVTAYPIEAKQY